MQITWQKVRYLYQKAAVLEVVLYDNVGDGVEHKLDVVCVRGTSEMGVDLFLVLSPVQALELFAYVARCVLISVGTLVFEETEIQRTACYFLLEQVLLVKEQDYRG